MQVDAVANSVLTNSIVGGIVNPKTGSVELPVQNVRMFPRLIRGLLPAVYKQKKTSSNFCCTHSDSRKLNNLSGNILKVAKPFVSLAYAGEEKLVYFLAPSMHASRKTCKTPLIHTFEKSISFQIYTIHN